MKRWINKIKYRVLLWIRSKSFKHVLTQEEWQSLRLSELVSSCAGPWMLTGVKYRKFSGKDGKIYYEVREQWTFNRPEWNTDIYPDYKTQKLAD